MPMLRAIGLMSGTSMDGIDVAGLRTDGNRLVERGPSLSIAYEAAFRRRIEEGLETAKSIGKRDERPGGLDQLERDITQRHAAAVRRFLAEAPGEWAQGDVVGFHGQTVLHRPEKALTVQLGDGALLLPFQRGEDGLVNVVRDFRRGAAD